MEEKIINVELTGVTPLLMHRFAGAEEVENPKTKRKTTTTKENDVNDTLYKLPNGKLYQPSESIRQAMVEAGKAFKQGKSNRSKVIASFVQVRPEAIVHDEQKWTTDRRAVVIPSTRGRVMRNRGRLDKWKLKFQLYILDSDEVSPNECKDILEYAGKYMGIGDYRPQKRGMYGTFTVTSFQESKK